MPPIAGDFDPDIILGYIELHRGELDADTDCPQCLQPFGDTGVFVGITGSLRLFGPVCGRCAHTE